MQDLRLPRKEPRIESISRFRISGIRNPLRLGRESLASFLGRRESCRGLSSRAQVGAFTAHQGAFLSGPGGGCEADGG